MAVNNNNDPTLIPRLIALLAQPPPLEDMPKPPLEEDPDAEVNNNSNGGGDSVELGRPDTDTVVHSKLTGPTAARHRTSSPSHPMIEPTRARRTVSLPQQQQRQAGSGGGGVMGTRQFQQRLPTSSLSRSFAPYMDLNSHPLQQQSHHHQLPRTHHHHEAAQCSSKISSLHMAPLFPRLFNHSIHHEDKENHFQRERAGGSGEVGVRVDSPPPPPGVVKAEVVTAARANSAQIHLPREIYTSVEATSPLPMRIATSEGRRGGIGVPTMSPTSLSSSSSQASSGYFSDYSDRAISRSPSPPTSAEIRSLPPIASRPTRMKPEVQMRAPIWATPPPQNPPPQLQQQTRRKRTPSSSKRSAKPRVHDGNRVSCHQCKRNTAPSQMLYCSNKVANKASGRACNKKFCVLCMERYCSSMAEVEKVQKETRAVLRETSAWVCPACKQQCSCAACLRKAKNTGRSELGTLRRKKYGKRKSGALDQLQPPPSQLQPQPSQHHHQQQERMMKSEERTPSVAIAAPPQPAKKQKTDPLK